MNALDTLKNELISDIMISTNEVLLRTLSEVFKSNSSKFSLTNEQIEMIQMGLDDIDNDRLVSEEDLAIEDAKWMK